MKILVCCLNYIHVYVLLINLISVQVLKINIKCSNLKIIYNYKIDVSFYIYYKKNKI